jgi:hypothetical protein
MPEFDVDERRSVPRYQERVPCTVLCSLTGATILARTEMLSLKSLSVTIPSNPTYGAEPSDVGANVELRLALPEGYVRLSGSLLHMEQTNSIGNLFVFKIEGANEVDQRLYHEHLVSLSLSDSS